LLDLMGGGVSAPMAIASVVAETDQIAYRQLAAVDEAGRVAGYSGERTLGRFRIVEGDGAIAAGNLLADAEVPAAMVAAFAAWPEGDLGDRLVDALIAGLEAGGEAGPVHSAGLLLAGEVPWPVADLRVDWSDDPIGDLAGLWQRWKPQMRDYVARALDPRSAPGYGVPGDP
jgi:uncharacterized Ntn-hydrolase superfamily protein